MLLGPFCPPHTKELILFPPAARDSSKRYDPSAKHQTAVLGSGKGLWGSFLGSGGILEAKNGFGRKMCQSQRVFSSKVARATLWRRRDERDPHKVPQRATKVGGRRFWNFTNSVALPCHSLHGHSLKNGGQASNDETKDNNADTMQNNMFSTNGLGTARENNMLCMAAALHNGQRYSRKRETHIPPVAIYLQRRLLKKKSTYKEHHHNTSSVNHGNVLYILTCLGCPRRQSASGDNIERRVLATVFSADCPHCGRSQSQTP